MANQQTDPRASDRALLGLPAQRAFASDPPPRPADIEQIRALHEGTLSREMELEIRDLTFTYREWADASQTILLEMTTKKGD